jgi:hypothetical protein
MNPLQFLTRPDPMPWPGRTNAGAEPGEPYKYRNPYPPPAGRKVRDRKGDIYVITPSGHARLDTTDDVADVRWGDLLAAGPVELVELTDAEKASEPVYGPIGARWGKPGTQCAYQFCALDQGHVGGHYDQAGNQLGMTDHADRMYVDPPRGMMLRRICTCGNHAQHQPGCARYVEPLAPMEHATHNGPNSLEAFGNLIGADDPAPTVAEQVADAVWPEPVKPPRKRTPRKVAGVAGPAPTGRKRAPRKAQP